jgi:hypothetical protein
MISVFNDTAPAPGPCNLAPLIQTATASSASSSATTTTLAREFAGKAAG